MLQIKKKKQKTHDILNFELDIIFVIQTLIFLLIGFSIKLEKSTYLCDVVSYIYTFIYKIKMVTTAHFKERASRFNETNNNTKKKNRLNNMPI